MEKTTTTALAVSTTQTDCWANPAFEGKDMGKGKGKGMSGKGWGYVDG